MHNSWYISIWHTWIILYVKNATSPWQVEQYIAICTSFKKILCLLFWEHYLTIQLMYVCVFFGESGCNGLRKLEAIYRKRSWKPKERKISLDSLAYVTTYCISSYQAPPSMNYAMKPHLISVPHSTTTYILAYSLNHEQYPIQYKFNIIS